MPTLQDVARKAGVAPITVSRVINHSGYVTQGVRDRVEAAVEELGYVPNSLARSLRSRRTDTLALVLSDITNPFFTTMARGVEDAASDAGYMVIVCNTDERDAEERRCLRMLLQKRVDGVLLVPALGADDSLRVLREQETPVVVLDRRVTEDQVDVVRCDAEAGAYQLCRLLCDLGHRDIAVLTGQQGVSTSEDRAAACRRALRDVGAEERCRVLYGEFSSSSGERLTHEALAMTPRPTALFATNNFIALGAWKALREAGLRVPEDMALVGFDDLPSFMVAFPFLTVAAQPAYEMGQKAVGLLLRRLRGEAPEGYQELLLPTELIVRHSSGGPLGSPPASPSPLPTMQAIGRK